MIKVNNKHIPVRFWIKRIPYNYIVRFTNLEGDLVFEMDLKPNSFNPVIEAINSIPVLGDLEVMVSFDMTNDCYIVRCTDINFTEDHKVTNENVLKLLESSQDWESIKHHLLNNSEPTFRDYFHEEIDYPDVLGSTVLPIGTEWNYVASSFLDGIVNYAKPIKAFLLNRYYEWEELIEDQKYDNEFLTKEQIFNKLTSNPSFHTKIYSLRDDVIILSKIKDSDNMYIYFWYDIDCSDCSVGRFISNQGDDKVIELFSKWVSEMRDNQGGSVEVPLDFFQGWMSGH